MDVPLALNNIGIRNGAKGYKGKSSTFSQKTVVDGLSASIKASTNLTTEVHNKLSDSEFGKNVVHIVVDNVVDKMKAMNPTGILSSIAGGFEGLKATAVTILGGSVLGKFFSLLRELAENMLANNFNGMSQKNGAEIVPNMIGNDTPAFMNTPIAKLHEGKDGQIQQIVNTVESVYRTIISEHFPRIMEFLDIAKIVRERINEMDVNETEELVFQVMNKEPKAIVWLEASRGMIMGSINVLI